MTILDADPSHWPAIRSIFNEVIASTTAIYQDDPLSEQDLADWFAAKQPNRRPVLVALGDGGEVIGFAALSDFSPKPGYRYTAEHTLHVATDHRGRGVGRALLTAIEEAARETRVHTLVGKIDADNEASRRLHESAGFHLTGQLRQVGRKFDCWLDVCFYQKLLADGE